MGPLIALEGAARPACDVWWCPGVGALLPGKGSAGVLQVARVEEATTSNRLGSDTDEYSIHDDSFASGEIACYEFLLGGDFFVQGPGLRTECDGGARQEIAEGDDGVVGRMDAEGGYHVRFL